MFEITNRKLDQIVDVALLKKVIITDISLFFKLVQESADNVANIWKVYHESSMSAVGFSLPYNQHNVLQSHAKLW